MSGLLNRCSCSS